MKPIEVKRYENEKQLEKDGKKMAARGYVLASTTTEQPRSGCSRWLFIGPLALIFKPKPVLIVTWARTAVI